MIKKLSPEAQSRLRSTVIINGYRKCMEEIVVNSLDAGASEIAILVDFSDKCYIEICDNGRSMTYEEMSVVGKRYYTSKSSVEKYYGYRGESLASIIDTCKLFSILCFTGSHKMIKSFEGGNLMKLEVYPVSNQCRINKTVSKKTIISVTDLYCKTPVRFKALNKYYELRSLKSLIESLAIINFSVSFKLQINGNVEQIYEWKSCGTMLESLETLFLRQNMTPMENVEVEVGFAKLEGLIGVKFGVGLKIEFLFFNKRPISPDDKFFKEIQRKFSKMKMKIARSKESCLIGNYFCEHGFSSILFVLNFQIKSKDTHSYLHHFDACMEQLLKIIEPNIRATSLSDGSIPFSSYKDLEVVANKLLENIEKPLENMTSSQNVYKIYDNVQLMFKENSIQSTSEGSINSSRKSKENALKPHKIENSHPINFTRIKNTLETRSFDYHEYIGINSKFDVDDSIEGKSFKKDSSLSSPVSKIKMSFKDASSSSSSPPPSWSSSSVIGLMRISRGDSANLFHLDPPQHYHHHLFKSHKRLALNKVKTTDDHSNGMTNLNLKKVYSNIGILQMMLNKEMFKNVQVIGQVDKKFVACLVKNKNGQVIILADQHAADERIRLERLLKDIKVPVSKILKNGSKFKVQISEIENNDDNDIVTEENLKEMVMTKPCLPNIEINLDCQVVKSVESIRALLSRNGLKFRTLKNCTNSILVTDVPLCFNGDKEWIKELIFDSLEKRKQNVNQLPAPIFKQLCSIACHGAIKFGDQLSNRLMNSMIDQLGCCHLPFQCAHGRPTIIPLLNFNSCNHQKIKSVESFSKRLSMLVKCKKFKLD